MNFRSILQHLRIPFSLFLAPVYLFSVSQLHSGWTWKLGVVFIILHFLVYPASHAYNSFYDRDRGSIGGLAVPPPVDGRLKRVALTLEFIAVLLSFAVSTAFAAMILIYQLVSNAYSHPSIRLKRYPVLSWIVVAAFQGAWIFMAVQIGGGAELNSVAIQSAVLASLWVAASYPLTQIYQHEEDAERGDLTLSRVLQVRGTFYLSGALLATSSAWFVLSVSFRVAILFLALTLPVLIYFLVWMTRSFQNEREANFVNTMRMNQISAACMSLFFLLLSFNAIAADPPLEKATGTVKDSGQTPAWFQFKRWVREGADSVQLWTSQFDDPVTGDPWVQEDLRLKPHLEFVGYHYVQNQTHDEGSIESLSGEKIEFRFKHDGHEQKKVRDRPERLAVPPMIENIISEKWKQLLAGETYSFNLAVPDRMDFYGFKVFFDRTEGVGSSKTWVMKLKPSSLFVAAAVNPVYLFYNPEGRLLRAVGRCPVLLKTGEGLEEREADVRYIW